MTAQNTFEDHFLNGIAYRLSTTRDSTATLDTNYNGRSPTVWRREDQIAVEIKAKQAEPIAQPKQRIRPTDTAPVIVAKTVVVKPDPAIAIEAARKAAEQRRAAAAKVEAVRLENERAEARRAAAAAEAARQEENRRSEEVQRQSDEADRLAWLDRYAAPKPKATAQVTEPTKVVPSTKRKPGQGVSLEQLRAMAVAPIVIAPPMIQRVPAPKPVKVAMFAPRHSNAPKSEWEIAADTRRAEEQAFIARIRNLCPVVVARLHRDVVGILKTWPSVERMVELATQYSYCFKKEDLLPFIAACETAMAKIKK